MMSRGQTIPAHEEYVAAVAGDCLEALSQDLPSGRWKGYYSQNRRSHQVAEFHLLFGPMGSVAGSGQDDIGRYEISGQHRHRRVAFSKTYALGSSNVSGRQSEGNRGHTVEYRGRFAGAALGTGFRGAWTIRGGGRMSGHLNGEFHLWPAMDGWQDTSDSSNSFEVAEGSECVVCMDRQIRTRLIPCGHVALCEQCATRVSSQGCPLCRTYIERIVVQESKRQK